MRAQVIKLAEKEIDFLIMAESILGRLSVQNVRAEGDEGCVDEAEIVLEDGTVYLWQIKNRGRVLPSWGLIGAKLNGERFGPAKKWEGVDAVDSVVFAVLICNADFECTAHHEARFFQFNAKVLAALFVLFTYCFASSLGMRTADFGVMIAYLRVALLAFWK